MNACPRVLLEGGAALGVEPVDRRDERLEPAREEIVDLAPGGELAQLAVDDVLDDAGVPDHQAIAKAGIGSASVFGV